MVKVQWGSFLSWLFLPIWEEKICGPGRENFLPGFPPFLFSLYSQTEENSVFYPIFLPIFSILPKFHPTKNSVRGTHFLTRELPKDFQNFLNTLTILLIHFGKKNRKKSHFCLYIFTWFSLWSLSFIFIAFSPYLEKRHPF